MTRCGKTQADRQTQSGASPLVESSYASSLLLYSHVLSVSSPSPLEAVPRQNLSSSFLSHFDKPLPKMNLMEQQELLIAYVPHDLVMNDSVPLETYYLVATEIRRKYNNAVHDKDW
jgi:hypothetical protein